MGGSERRALSALILEVTELSRSLRSQSRSDWRKSLRGPPSLKRRTLTTTQGTIAIRVAIAPNVMRMIHFVLSSSSREFKGVTGAIGGYGTGGSGGEGGNRRFALRSLLYYRQVPLSTLLGHGETWDILVRW